MTHQEMLAALKQQIDELQIAYQEYQRYLDLVHQYARYVAPEDKSAAFSLAALNLTKSFLATGKYLSYSMMLASPLVYLYEQVSSAMTSNLVILPMVGSIITSTLFMVGADVTDHVEKNWWQQQAEKNASDAKAMPKALEKLLNQAANSNNFFIDKFRRGNKQPTRLFERAVELERTKLLINGLESLCLYRDSKNLLSKINRAQEKARTAALDRLKHDIDDKVTQALRLGLKI